MRAAIIIGLWGFITACVLACAFLLLRPSAASTLPVTLGDATITVWLAKTPSEQAKGLGDTNQLADGRGMLFVMPGASRWGFWMKDMRYGLDIVWLNAGKQVIYIAASIAPSTYPKVFAPAMPASYVIELPAGYAQKHGIVPGTHANFNL
ncbi:MAG TPA: DUF192 domain-containing protein [Candidatus Acidoferrum sp.]|nr:DUF192 domain-containing protein [Candidatus Acidoferrum sp.]